MIRLVKGHNCLFVSRERGGGHSTWNTHAHTFGSNDANDEYRELRK